jgi:small subunit ribosomal protein S18|tara:strand:+ start:290 stop:571 length:282 start_codon:yes stop_codon:yes gene_type:complete
MLKRNNKTKPREDKKNSPFDDRKRFCPFSQKNSPKIDYKDTKMLSRYISEKGKITPSRITNVSSKKQKVLANAIKRARFLSLMSYTQKYTQTK